MWSSCTRRERGNKVDVELTFFLYNEQLDTHISFLDITTYIHRIGDTNSQLLRR